MGLVACVNRCHDGKGPHSEGRWPNRDGRHNPADGDRAREGRCYCSGVFAEHAGTGPFSMELYADEPTTRRLSQPTIPTALATREVPHAGR